MSEQSAPAPAASRQAVARVIAAAVPPFRRSAPAFAWGALALACGVLLMATSAWLITYAAEEPPVLYLTAAAVAVRAFALARAVFRYLERLSGHDAAFRRLADLRAGLYERLVPRAPDGLGRFGRGDLLTRLVSDIDTLQDEPLRVRQPLVTAVAVAIAAVGVGVVFEPAVALVTAVLLALAVLAGWVLGSRGAGRAERDAAPLRGRLGDQVLDYLARLDVLVAFGAEREARERIRETETALGRTALRSAFGAGATAAIVSLLSGGATLAAIVLVAPGALSGGIPDPIFAAIVLTPLAVFEAFSTTPLVLAARHRVRASAERLAEVTETAVPAAIPTEGATAGGAELPAGIGTGLRLRGVTARWPGADEDCLRGADLDLAPGERVLLSGPSGAGKTALAHVLVRFLEHRGSYLLGGVDVHDAEPDAVRTRVGLVEQTPYLFDTSIRHNIDFASDDPSDERLTAVLARVGLAEWLSERGGLDAAVGEHGELVSGGQAQRIALARALLADFPVLVLDEPTANVDAERADALLTDLLGTAGDRAVLLISHTDIPRGLVGRAVRLDAGVLVAA